MSPHDAIATIIVPHFRKTDGAVHRVDFEIAIKLPDVKLRRGLTLLAWPSSVADRILRQYDADDGAIKADDGDSTVPLERAVDRKDGRVWKLGRAASWPLFLRIKHRPLYGAATPPLSFDEMVAGALLSDEGGLVGLCEGAVPHLLPGRHQETVPQTVEWRLPPATRVGTDALSSLGPRSEVWQLRMPPAGLCSVTLAVGPKLRTWPSPLPRRSFGVVWMGDDLPSAIQAQLVPLQKHYKELTSSLFGDDDNTRLPHTIFVRQGPTNAATVSEAHGNVTLLTYASAQEVNDLEPDRVFHRLAKGIVRSRVYLEASPEAAWSDDKPYWFQDGLADFYAVFPLSGPPRADLLNHLAQLYFTHPHHGRRPAAGFHDTASPAGHLAASSRAWDSLRGLMHLVRLDFHIRRGTANEHSLDDCVRRLVQERAAGAAPDLRAWITIVGDVWPGSARTKPSYRVEATQFGNGWRTVEVPPDALAHRGLHGHAGDVPVRALGFAEISLSAGVVVGCHDWTADWLGRAQGAPDSEMARAHDATVDARNAARAALLSSAFATGLRDGDRLARVEGWHDWWGDAPELRLRVRGAGAGAGAEAAEPRLVAYEPRGPELCSCIYWAEGPRAALPSPSPPPAEPPRKAGVEKGRPRRGRRGRRGTPARARWDQASEPEAEAEAEG